MYKPWILPGVRRKIIPLESTYVFRFGPLSVRLPAIDRVFSVFTGKVHGFCVRSSPFSRAFYHKVRILQHSFIIFFENAFIAVFAIKI